MAKCKRCGAEIIWIWTVAGHSMPCDPEQVTYWEKTMAKGRVVTPNGMIFSCEYSGDPNKAAGVGYVSHWSTCPKVGQRQFRRKNNA